jgi:hypothetical protein
VKEGTERPKGVTKWELDCEVIYMIFRYLESRESERGMTGEAMNVH